MNTPSETAIDAESRGQYVLSVRVHEHGAERMPFVVFTPSSAKLDGSRKLPLVVFLHGRGESGTDGLKPAAQGLIRMALFNRERWGCVVIAPQKPSEDRLWDEHEEQVVSLIEDIKRTMPIDEDRVYLTGLSQGGHGAWMIGSRKAELFAAVVPICGWAGTKDGSGFEAGRLVGMPVWAFHGDADGAVPVEASRRAVEAVREAGGEAMLTEYPGVGHNSWDKAYDDAKLAEWMFAQRRRVR